MNAIAGTYSSMGRLAAAKKDFKTADRFLSLAIDTTSPSKDLSPRHAGQHYLFVLHKAEVLKSEGKRNEALKTAREALAGFKTLEQKQAVRIQRTQKLIEELKTVKTDPGSG